MSGSQAGWRRAYGPLGPRTLLVQLAVVVAAEAALLSSYRGHEASFHWATHFLVGLTAAAVLNTAWLAVKGAPMPGQLISVLALHLLAMFPDVLFNAGIPHDEWMDVFLGHVAAHDIPGADRTWLVVALAASGLYAWVLSRWLAARTAEAARGMAPGIGLGGSALVRPQSPPGEAILSHTPFGRGGASEVVLLHGLGASREVWTGVVAELEARGMAGVVPDLLGFGRSRTIGTQFDLDAHARAVLRLLEQSPGEPIVVVGHSFGCAVAVALAAAAPERVRALVLVSPPVFHDPQEAHERLAREGWLTRQVLSGSPVASATCNLMCLLRGPAGRLVARRARRVPRRLALDGVQHSWPAYRDAVKALLEDNPLPAAIALPIRPTAVVVSDDDARTPAQDVLGHPHDAVRVVELAGDHLVPLDSAAIVAEVIAATARGAVSPPLR